MKISQAQLKQTFEQGLQFLKQQQCASGYFLHYSAQQATDFTDSKQQPATFSSILIFENLLPFSKQENGCVVCQQLAQFLLSQKSQNWTWNYWQRNSQQANHQPYPDDLDDTACAWAALYQYDQSLFSGQALSLIMQVLTKLEVKTGGPYRTWLANKTDPKIWQDVDLAVNANIGYFLSLLSVKVPGITALVRKAVSKKGLKSKYYHQPLPIIYFIARWFREDQNQLLAQVLQLEQKLGPHWGNALNCSLALLSLLQLEYPEDKMVGHADWLLQQQQSNGSWPAYGLYPDPVVNEQTYYAGSTALTTSFCLRSLYAYQQKQEGTSPDQHLSQAQQQKDWLGYQQKVKQRVKNLFSDCHSFAQQAHKLIQRVMHKDAQQQIILLPLMFKRSLKPKLQQRVSTSLLTQLSMANLLGWMAYRVYDDILDQEGGRGSLPLANSCLRKTTMIYQQILPDNQFGQVFAQIMDQVEQAHDWEMRHCRVRQNRIKQKQEAAQLSLSELPDYNQYEQLAHRSCGHYLPIKAILCKLGYLEDSQANQSLTQFARHYLIARQLNDDAHDWQRDLKHGHINAVAALLVQDFLQDQTQNTITLKQKTWLQLATVFWQQTVTRVNQLILEHVELACKNLKQCSLVSDKQWLQKLIDRHRITAQQAQQEKHRILEFTNHFYSTPPAAHVPSSQ